MYYETKKGVVQCQACGRMVKVTLYADPSGKIVGSRGGVHVCLPPERPVHVCLPPERPMTDAEREYDKNGPTIWPYFAAVLLAMAAICAIVAKSV